MKAFASALLIAFAAATSVGQRQQFPSTYGDFRDQLPTFQDGWKERNPNVYRPTREARVLTKGPLAPSAADRTNNASFLRHSNTGLIRLLPRIHKHSKFYKPNQSVKINGGGAYYSFANLSHEYGYGSDLKLAATIRIYSGIEAPPSYELLVGFTGYDYGMMTNLGDVLLETLTHDDPHAQFMANYKPPREKPEARSEFRRFRAGVSIDGQTYKRSLAIQVGSTYLLRSINYGESDVLVAFRIVREDSDNSLIIAWRMLKKFAPPKLNSLPPR
ncbi:MAG: hypothetical protein ACT4OT_03410 [Acidobacteriota bacterium]